MKYDRNRGNANTDFQYSPDGVRWRQVNNDPDNNRHLTTYYFGKAFEYVVKTENGATTYENRHYVGDYLVYTTRSGASSATTARYLHGDHLGSVDTITTDTGGSYEVKGFDAFGKPRAAWSNEILPGVVLSDTTNRGFTAHEHLDSQGLIHMNGRAYDPYLGRFLSVDPFIQFPENSQSLNPYSYILNNPLSGTDPTGYLLEIPDGPIPFPGPNGPMTPPQFGFGGSVLSGSSNGADGQGTRAAENPETVETGDTGGSANGSDHDHSGIEEVIVIGRRGGKTTSGRTQRRGSWKNGRRVEFVPELRSTGAPTGAPPIKSTERYIEFRYEYNALKPEEYIKNRDTHCFALCD